MIFAISIIVFISKNITSIIFFIFRLTASEFSAANINHLKIIKEMGINIIALRDGRVQLLHTPSSVSLFSRTYNIAHL